MIGVLKSLTATMSTMMRKPVTIQYPTEHRKVPERDRAFPILLWDFDVDEPFCTGCHACERACPVECMTVTMKDNPKFAEGKSKRRKIIDEFYIDYGRCMRCNICVEVCNFDAIAMNNTWAGHELSTFDRNDLVVDLDQLLDLSKSRQLQAWDPATETRARAEAAAPRPPASQVGASETTPAAGSGPTPTDTTAASEDTKPAQ